ncbi:MAG: response regulator [Candidatus Margulisbacteria bacterium]|nr:response regulator [Candidatus Margulisiibacteriota bacterium]MBU1617580.1 response regulator [Candidatus Margulisiibacteriota bacterium]MBU1866918.1 response regulator [Candidatus Margulisiibacteriota bacterium]
MAKSVLVIEDFPATLSMFKQIIETAGYEFQGVETGEKALEVLARKKFDLILLDIMLPRVDGFEVARRARTSRFNRATPIIALTAFDVADITNRCRAAGINDVFLKPFEVDNLIDVINKHLMAP